MDGLATSAFAMSVQTRFAIVRDILLLLAVVTYHDNEAHGVVTDIPTLLASVTSTFRIFSLMRWVITQPMIPTTGDIEMVSGQSQRGSDENFLNRFSGLNVSHQQQHHDSTTKEPSQSHSQVTPKSRTRDLQSPTRLYP